jgi:iron complex outermembrane receptor protein
VFNVELQSQNHTGKVIDSENSFELSNVIIQNISGTFSTLTNPNGSFYLPKTGTYIFSKKGYKSKTISIAVDAYSIIKLTVTRERLNEVIITSNNFKSKLSTLPSAVSVLTSENIKNNNLINIAPILNLAPGIFMHNGTLTTNRITIRGIGSRNLYGTSKIRAYYQDIPLTNGSGSSTIEDLEMSTLGRIEVFKGPSSSTYGAGLGGTIQLIPQKGIFEEVSLSSGYTFGSFGLQKYLLQLNLANTKNVANVTYSNINSDGYRRNNETERQSLTVASQHFIGGYDKLIFIGNYIDLKAFIPSSINEGDYLNNPTTAAFTWGKAKGYEDFKKGLFGLSWQHDYSPKTKQFTSLFTSFTNAFEPRPFNILKEKTNGIGLRSRISSNTTVFNKSLEWTFGGEVFNDVNSYKTYENLYNDFPPEFGSVKGGVKSNFKEKRSYFNLFLDSKYKLSKSTIASFGLNFNHTSYTLNDLFTSDTVDYSGKYNFGVILSPKLGLTYQMTQNTMLYTTVSHGFSPPTLEETLLPDGLINMSIKPESGWNFEFGSRGRLFNNKLLFDFAFYTMHVKNLLVARRTANDEFIGVNAGKTKYNGLELTLNYHLINTEKLKIYHTNAFAYNDFKFKTFVDDGNDYSGNDLTGVPNLTFNSNLNFESNIGIYAFLNYNMIGEIPMRDDNSVYSKKHQLVNCKIGYKSNETKKIQFNMFVGINNLFNEKYASMLLINAGIFGGNAPRYYYPGEPTNYYSGLNLKYVF